MGRRGQFKNAKQNKQKPMLKLTDNQRKLHEIAEKLLKITTTPQQQNVTKEMEVLNEIFVLLEEIRSLESEIEFKAPADLRRNTDTVNRFTTWLNENGAEFKGTSIAEFPGYDLGLKADVDVQESTLIIAVPRKLMMTVEAAKKSAMGCLIEKDTLLSNMPNVALSMFLLLEKFKESSFWKPYINILPESYSTVLYFSRKDLDELVGSPTLRSTLLQIKSIARQYAYFYKLIWTTESLFCEIIRKHFTYNSYW